MTRAELNAVAAKLAGQIASAHRATVEVVPPGWFTSRELANKTGREQANIVRDIRLVGAEKRKFVVKSGSRVFPVNHYKLK
jgi:hypothetical protein